MQTIPPKATRVPSSSTKIATSASVHSGFLNHEIPAGRFGHGTVAKSVASRVESFAWVGIFSVYSYVCGCRIT